MESIFNNSNNCCSLYEHEIFRNAIMEVDLNGTNWINEVEAQLPTITIDQMKDQYMQMLSTATTSSFDVPLQVQYSNPTIPHMPTTDSLSTQETNPYSSFMVSSPAFPDSWTPATFLAHSPSLPDPLFVQEDMTPAPTNAWNLSTDQVSVQDYVVSSPLVPPPPLSTITEGKKEREKMMGKRPLVEVEVDVIPPPYMPEVGEEKKSRRGRKKKAPTERESLTKGKPWTEEEHRLFLLGMEVLGKSEWKRISDNFVITRTSSQVASHAQKYFKREVDRRPKQRPSIHDIRSIGSPSLKKSQVLSLYDIAVWNKSYTPPSAPACNISQAGPSGATTMSAQAPLINDMPMVGEGSYSQITSPNSIVSGGRAANSTQASCSSMEK